MPPSQKVASERVMALIGHDSRTETLSLGFLVSPRLTCSIGLAGKRLTWGGPGVFSSFAWNRKPSKAPLHGRDKGHATGITSLSAFSWEDRYQPTGAFSVRDSSLWFSFYLLPSHFLSHFLKSSSWISARAKLALNRHLQCRELTRNTFGTCETTLNHAFCARLTCNMAVRNNSFKFLIVLCIYKRVRTHRSR